MHVNKMDQNDDRPPGKPHPPWRDATDSPTVDAEPNRRNRLRSTSPLPRWCRNSELVYFETRNPVRGGTNKCYMGSRTV